MFFSGQLLDDYSRCVEALSPMAIRDILPEEGEEAAAGLPDRAKVTVAGVITSVTVKTTKKDERMAFFTVEDSGGELECLAFPKVYLQTADIIRPDNAVFVEGNLSVREEETPKVLVSVLGLLVDNEHFTSTPKPAGQPPRGGTEKPDPGAQGPVAQGATGQRPRAEQGTYNPYAAMTPGGAYNPYAAMPAAVPPRGQAPAGPAPRPSPAEVPAPPQPRTPAPTAQPKKLYLRVEDREGESYRKAANLCAIFCDGQTEVVVYDKRDGKYYATGMRVKASPLLLARLSSLLGENNVVAK